MTKDECTLNLCLIYFSCIRTTPQVHFEVHMNVSTNLQFLVWTAHFWACIWDWMGFGGHFELIKCLHTHYISPIHHYKHRNLNTNVWKIINKEMEIYSIFPYLVWRVWTTAAIFDNKIIAKLELWKYIQLIYIPENM